MSASITKNRRSSSGSRCEGATRIILEAVESRVLLSASVSYLYVSAQPSYTLQEGTTATVKVYLQETTNGLPSIIDDPKEEGLLGAAFEAGSLSQPAGAATITAATSDTNDFNGGVNQVTINNQYGYEQGTGADNSPVVYTNEADVNEGIAVSNSVGVLTGNSGAPAGDVFLGTMTIAAGTAAGTTTFSLGEFNVAGNSGGNTVTNSGVVPATDFDNPNGDYTDANPAGNSIDGTPYIGVGTKTYTFSVITVGPTPTVAVTSAASAVFSGANYVPTDTVTGIAGADTATASTYAFYQGSTTTTPLASAPSTVGTYTVVASFPGDSTYSAANSTPFTFTITQATPSVTVSDAGGAFTGSTFPATAKVNGSASLESVTPSLTYYTGTKASGTPLSGAPSAVGTYTVAASFAGSSDYAHAASNPATFVISTAVTPVTVTSVVINGNNAALAGVQRSMVTSIVYTFSSAVQLAATNAFTIAVHAGQTGTLPTALTWTAISPAGDGSSTQWAVTFSGTANGGPSIDDGVYDITLNTAAVTSDANPSAPITPRATDTFYRLFGDVGGAERVNNASYNSFLNTYNLKSTQTGYLAAFDATGTNAKISNADYNLFLNNYNKKLSGFTATI